MATGNREPTPLDALLFAYLHCLLHARPGPSPTKDTRNVLRFEVARRANLVAWEERVREEVRGAFEMYAKA